MKCLIIIFIIFIPCQLKAQLYLFDNIPQRYEVLLIENAKRKRVKDINYRINNIRQKEDYSNKEKRSMIVFYRTNKKIIKHSLSSKCGYVLLLKNCETGGYFDVIVSQCNNNEGGKIKVNNVYDVQLFKLFENDMVPKIGYVWKINMDNCVIEVTGASHTSNIYTYVEFPKLNTSKKSDKYVQ